MRSFPGMPDSIDPDRIISPYKGRLWLDDVSPHNVAVAADTVSRFIYMMTDKIFFEFTIASR